MSGTSESKTPSAAAPRGNLITYLQLDGAVKAAELYQKAFGATLAAMYPPDDKGRTMHVHLYVNGSSLMMSDFYPEHGFDRVAPQGFSLTLIVKDIESDFRRAVDAGCTPVLAPQRMFWGDLYAQVRDPFGVLWAMDQGSA